jgi:hypothetical protein
MGLSAFAAITAFGILVAGVMWLIQRWHAHNEATHPQELARLLAIARRDEH